MHTAGLTTVMQTTLSKLTVGSTLCNLLSCWVKRMDSKFMLSLSSSKTGSTKLAKAESWLQSPPGVLDWVSNKGIPMDQTIAVMNLSLVVAITSIIAGYLYELGNQ